MPKTKRPPSHLPISRTQTSRVPVELYWGWLIICRLGSLVTKCRDWSPVNQTKCLYYQIIQTQQSQVFPVGAHSKHSCVCNRNKDHVHVIPCSGCSCCRGCGCVVVAADVQPSQHMCMRLRLSGVGGDGWGEGVIPLSRRTGKKGIKNETAQFSH